MSLAPFDQKHAKSFNESRRKFLDEFLPSLRERCDLKTALDVGCGFGFFSSYLRRAGFQVSAFDGREENALEARKRDPEVNFETHDVEDPALPAQLGSHDLVLCFGLLYHLENPFRALRNLAALAEKVLVVETRVAPFRSNLALLYEENYAVDQALGYMAMVPSTNCLVKMMYIAGFPFVYGVNVLPDHEQFRGSPIRKPMRKMFVAARCALQVPNLRAIREPLETNRYRWHRFGIGNALERLVPLFRPYGKTWGLPRFLQGAGEDFNKR
jgi:SAM-dependent methyltransferase